MELLVQQRCSAPPVAKKTRLGYEQRIRFPGKGFRCLRKKKNNVRGFFAKFSRSFRNNFKSVRKFFEVFGRIRMRLDAFERFLAEEIAEKTKQTF